MPRGVDEDANLLDDGIEETGTLHVPDAEEYEEGVTFRIQPQEV